MNRRPRWLPGDLVPRLVAPVAEKVDRSVGWDRLSTRMGIVALLGIRHRLRERNLYDTRRPAPAAAAPASVGARAGARTLDGTGTDPADPCMGALRTPFGRNTPPLEDRDGPPAQAVSDALLLRTEFFPAETLNLLAAAWLQFEVHDWFAHATTDYDPTYVARHQDDVADPRPLVTDPETGRRPAPFVSDQTHWWDASQLYGARPDFEEAVRVDGTWRVKDDLDLIQAMEEFTGGGGVAASAPNLWLGTALFHILFAREHNAIGAILAEAHPTWDDQRVFDKARLINAAVMAKIHTVEWTPAVVAHPAAAAGARKSWFGVVSREHRPLLARFRDEVLTGIPGSRLDHDGAPYALTEEFVAVYRMHQLIPDEVAFREVRTGRDLGSCGMEEITIEHGDVERPRIKLDDIGCANAVYSLAIAHPGEITLHNHPRFLRRYKAADGQGLTIDLGMVDILRTRQTAVPRYNDFRRLFRLQPAGSFHEIANGNPKWAKEIRDVYDTVDDVDLLIGMYAERKPKGFAFSDTAFRVFLLMAARRLRSDRFFTTDYTAEVYTPEGLRRIEEATLAGMLERHFDGLGPVPENVFAPWPA